MKNPEAIKHIRSFNRFYTNIIGVIDRHFLDTPFSLTEGRVLFEIYHDSHATVRKIKNFLHVDEGYLSRTVEKLVKQGLVLRKQSKADGRSFILSLSKKGKKAFLVLNARQESATEALLATLSQEEIDELVSNVMNIQKLLGKE